MSHNNTHGIGDMYHSSSSVDQKDLCVVWGQNTSKDLLENIQFWSEPWSCNYHTNSREVFQQFDHEALSNNHMLAPEGELQRVIDTINIGDQIEVRGWLVNYWLSDASETIRKTSTTRTDVGNGACEVFFAQSIRIIESATPLSYKAYYQGRVALAILLLLRLLTFFIFPYLEYREML